MKKEESWWWSVPAEAIQAAVGKESFTALQGAWRENINYREGNILGFPGTTPEPVALAVHAWFSELQANNIGCHTLNRKAEFGFPGTQRLEREFVYDVARLFGAQDPEHTIDGYLCGGGTEGNEHAMWGARNKLQARSFTGNTKRGIVVLRSFLAHYSVDKAANRLLGINPKTCEASDGSVLHELHTNAEGELNAEIVDHAIRFHYGEGYRRFIVYLTAGTINMGSIDRVSEISRHIGYLKRTLRIVVHVHVDAAFGGFVIPFLYPDLRFAFDNKHVDSVSVDIHKMGYVPYPAGLFLARKGFIGRWTTTKATYLGGHNDRTSCGSRPGANAAACWATFRTLGRDGYRERVLRCMGMRDYIQSRMREFKGAYIYPSRLNVFAVRFPLVFTRAMLVENGDGMSLHERYCIPEDRFPRNLTRSKWKGKVLRRPCRVFRFAAMPHVTRQAVDEFVDVLRRAAGPA